MMIHSARTEVQQSTTWLALMLVLLLPAACTGDPAKRPASKEASVSLTALVARLEQAVATDSAAAESRRLLHQLRNGPAMAELVASLPAQDRPQRLLYLAAGSHLAPLVVCEALPGDAACSLRYTEIDASVQERIERGLQALHLEGCLSAPSSTAAFTSADGERTWHFELAGHAVDLTLLVTVPGAGSSLLSPDDLVWPQLVISHDWSGDPIENLRVIRAYLLAARAERPATLPLLMIEDLERHPYPIDLTLFMPLARTALPYGHRASSAGIARHGGEELGVGLFGGGVLLGFGHTWWLQGEQASLDGVLDLLLLNRFDSKRQNVLEGGDDPLLAPALLDWWTAFGDRSVTDDHTRLDRSAALRAAQRVAPLLHESLRHRLGCRISLYRCLLAVRSAGGDERALLPSSRLLNRPRPGSFPSPEMEQQYRMAMRRTGAYRAAQAEERRQARQLLAILQEPQLRALADLCPVPSPSTPGADGQAWVETHSATLDWLNTAEE